MTKAPASQVSATTKNPSLAPMLTVPLVRRSRLQPPVAVIAAAARNGQTGSSYPTAMPAGRMNARLKYLTSAPTRFSAPRTSTPRVGARRTRRRRVASLKVRARPAAAATTRQR